MSYDVLTELRFVTTVVTGGRVKFVPASNCKFGIVGHPLIRLVWLTILLIKSPIFGELGEDEHSVAIKMAVGATITAHTQFLDKISAE